MTSQLPNFANVPCKMSFLQLQHGSWRLMQKMVVIGNLAVMRLLMIVVGADRYWWRWQMQTAAAAAQLGCTGELFCAASV